MKYAIDHQSIFLAKQLYNRAWDAQVEAGFRREDLRNRYGAIFDTLSVLGIPFHFDSKQHLVIDYEKMEEVHE